MDTARLDRPTKVAAPPFLAEWTRWLPVTFAVLTSATLFIGAHELIPQDHRAAELLLQRGLTQPLTVLLFFWGVGHVLRRLLVQLGEWRALDRCRELISGGDILRREDVPRMIGNLFPLRDSLSGPILHAVMSYFRAQRPTRDEVLKIADQEMDRAYERVEADYKPLTATMWLLPLSGFLGTVVGMAEAIGGFDQVINGLGGDLTALGPSVEGLSKAFDTTLLALGLVVPLKLMEVIVEGRDRRLLEAVDRTLATGYVRTLDLAVLAQKSPEQEAFDRLAHITDRIESNLEAMDRALARMATRMATMPDVGEAVSELVKAARVTRQALPHVSAELRALVEQGERPIVIQRKRS